jgi:hypothetical protein
MVDPPRVVKKRHEVAFFTADREYADALSRGREA